LPTLGDVSVGGDKYVLREENRFENRAKEGGRHQDREKFVAKRMRDWLSSPFRIPGGGGGNRETVVVSKKNGKEFRNSLSTTVWEGRTYAGKRRRDR